MGHKSGRALSTTASFCSSFVIISCQAARIGYLAAPAASIRPRDPCCTMRRARRAWLKTHEQQPSFQNNTSLLHYFISVNGLLALFSKSCVHSLTHWHTQTSLRRPGSLGPLTLRLLMSYIFIYGAPILDVSRSHTTTQQSR